MKSAGKGTIFFVFSILAVHVIFFIIALQQGSIFNGDSHEYIQEAENIRNHMMFYSGDLSSRFVAEDVSLRTPLYPLFLSLFYTLGFGNFAVLFFQNLISLGNIFYVRRQFRRLGYRTALDPLLCFFLLFFPSQFVYANTIAPDILLQSCVLVYCSQAISFLGHGNWRNAFWMSVALVFGLFIKPVVYPFSLIHLLLVLWVLLRQRRTVFRMLLAATLPLLLIAAYSYTNYLRTGKVHFSSIQSFNAIYYYHHFYAAQSGLNAADTFLQVEREKIAGKADFTERYDYAHRRGLQLLEDNFFPYLLFHLKSSLHFFFETGKGELDLFLGHTTLDELYGNQTVTFGSVVRKGDFVQIGNYMIAYPTTFLALLTLFTDVVKIGGLILFCWFTRVKSYIKWFTILFIIYFALITGPITNAHYVLPVSLIISCLAAIGIRSALKRRRQNRLTN